MTGVDDLLEAFAVVAYGVPAPQGSKRHVGGGRMIEQSKRVAPWRTDVKHAALAVIDSLPGWRLLDGPLAVAMTFTFPRPKGHWRTGRNAHLLRDAAPARPAGIPDLSKLARSTEDALTGVVWADDSRVVEYVRLAKYWAGTSEPDVLAEGAGAVIRVWQLAATSAQPQETT